MWYNPLCWFSDCEEEEKEEPIPYMTSVFAPTEMEVERGGFHLLGETN